MERVERVEELNSNNNPPLTISDDECRIYEWTELKIAVLLLLFCQSTEGWEQPIRFYNVNRRDNRET